MSARRQELADLGSRISAQGFGMKPVGYFSDDAIIVFVPPENADFGHVTPVIERSVNLYPCEGGWEARMTVHGGPHWVRRLGDDLHDGCRLGCGRDHRRARRRGATSGGEAREERERG